MRSRRSFLIGASLVSITVIVFGRIVGFGWVGWDDDIHVTENPGLHPVTIASVWEFWRAPYEGLYIPVSYTVYAAEAAISHRMFPSGALDPHLFHALSVLLHATCVLLVWRILCTRVAAGWPAVAGAMVFAVHPLQVESVAWISEQRGLLSAMLCLGVLCLPPGAAATPVRRSWGVGLFTLGILAKPQAVITPLLLAILDGKGSWRSVVASVRNSWPLLVTAAIVAVITKIQQPSEWSWEGADVATWLRPIVAGDAVCFYAEKFLVPLGLCLDYGRTPARVLSNPLLVLRAVLAMVVMAGICIVPRMRSIRVPILLVVVGLLPVLGLVPFTFQAFSTVADRYAYLPMLGAAVGIAQVASRVHRSHVVAAAAGFVAWLLALAVLTLGQLPTWHDSESLNKQIIRVNPHSAGGHLGLAAALLASERFHEAAEELRAAVTANPEYVKAHYELASTLHKIGLHREAEVHYRAALRLRPRWSYAHNDLGILLAEHGRLEEAVMHFREAVSLRPDLTAQRINLERAEAALKDSPFGDD
ncbi:MAG: tetratricopeptide repeat protein [Planctomycetota bacterium]